MHAKPRRAQTQQTVCDQRSFCQGGSNCFDTSNPPDQDFGRAMASMEAAREAGVYGADLTLFKGAEERCRKKLFGLVDCCKKGGGGAARRPHRLVGAGDDAAVRPRRWTHHLLARLLLAVCGILRKVAQIINAQRLACAVAQLLSHTKPGRANMASIQEEQPFISTIFVSARYASSTSLSSILS
ncbi:MAG: conjugal transfer protein TraN [Blastochloris sp.]|nr:conjugal transfer protein TraN [Blastochloris sp.]